MDEGETDGHALRKGILDPLHLTNGMTSSIKGNLHPVHERRALRRGRPTGDAAGYRYREMLAGGHDVMVAQLNAFAKTQLGLIKETSAAEGGTVSG